MNSLLSTKLTYCKVISDRVVLKNMFIEGLNSRFFILLLFYFSFTKIRQLYNKSIVWVGIEKYDEVLFLYYRN